MERKTKIALASGLVLALLAGLALYFTLSKDDDSRRPLPKPVLGSRVIKKPALTKVEAKSKPNVISIVADDMRWDDLQHAPNLQKIAKNGTFLANAFSNYPLCCPARASFLTGQLTHNHHVYTVKPPYAYGALDDRFTLATSFRSEGYSTGFVGKYLNGYGLAKPLAPKLAAEAVNEKPGRGARLPSQYYVPDGWDQWRGAIAETWCKPACGGAYHYFRYGFSANGVPKASVRGKYSSDVIGDQARSMARNFTKTREKTNSPFFMAVNYIAPHVGADDQENIQLRKGRAVYVPKCHLKSPAAPDEAYEAPSVQKVVRGAGVLPSGLTEESLRDKPGKFALFTKPNACEREGLLALARDRAASIYAMDETIGELVEELKRSGEWKRTVIVFWSDNGYAQGEHRRLSGKTLAYDPILRVPLLMAGPGFRGEDHDGILGGEDRYDPVGIPDLTATLLDLGGAEAPKQADGFSFKKTLLTKDRGWRTPVSVEAVKSSPRLSKDEPVDPRFVKTRDGIKDPRTSSGVRVGRYTYVRYENKEWELYDSAKDPFQWSNLAANKTWVRNHQPLLRALTQTWLTTKDCEAGECYEELPRMLSLSPKANRELTRKWYEKHLKSYNILLGDASVYVR